MESATFKAGELSPLRVSLQWLRQLGTAEKKSIGKNHLSGPGLSKVSETFFVNRFCGRLSIGPDVSIAARKSSALSMARRNPPFQAGRTFILSPPYQG